MDDSDFRLRFYLPRSIHYAIQKKYIVASAASALMETVGMHSTTEKEILICIGAKEEELTFRSHRLKLWTDQAFDDTANRARQAGIPIAGVSEITIIYKCHGVGRNKNMTANFFFIPSPLPLPDDDETVVAFLKYILCKEQVAKNNSKPLP